MAEANIRAAHYYYWQKGDSDTARMHIARAIALDPTDPLVVSVSLSDAIVEGRMEDAVDLQRRMVAIDPLSASERGNLGVLLMMTGPLDEAQVELERALELSPVGMVNRQNIAYVLLLQRRTDEALKVIRQLPAGHGRDAFLALAHFVRGDVVEGDAMLARLLAPGEAPGLDSGAAVEIAEVYVAKNDSDQAFKWLDFARRRAGRAGGPVSGKELRWNLHTAPFLKALHADPRWKELLAAIEKQ